MRRRFSGSSLLALSAGLGTILGGPPQAGADGLPQNGQVVAGSATIGGNASTMVIRQTSGRAIINWGGFSIADGKSVQFRQPGTGAAVLNRVTGTASSTIAGRL